MEKYYKLGKIKELADDDQEFIYALAQTFLEEVPQDAKTLKVAAESENYLLTYQIAHKMKPTIDMFELGVLQDLIEVQDWGRFEKTNEDISEKLEIVLNAIQNAVDELKRDFDL